MNTQQNWYEKYPKLSSIDFTWNDCGIRLRQPRPYGQYLSGDNYKELYQIDRNYRIIGYCLDTSIRPRRDMVAILFENIHDFERIWFHYMR